MKLYKANLSIIDSRYGDLEQRVLKQFAQQPNNTLVKIPGGNLIFLMYLLEDGYLKHIGHSEGHSEAEFPNYDIYEITKEGQQFVKNWILGKELD